jgi:DNA-directed RNA polymerase specialized sigma54-like protein
MYFFVSSRSLNNKILQPRIPKNRLTKDSREDNITPRICVSKSLLGCIESTDIYSKYNRIYVHICDSNSVIQPTREQVNDSYLLGEEWIIKPTEMKLFTILHVNKEIINEQYSKWNFINKDESMSFAIVGFDFNRAYKKE